MGASNFWVSQNKEPATALKSHIFSQGTALSAQVCTSHRSECNTGKRRGASPAKINLLQEDKSNQNIYFLKSSEVREYLSI